MEQNVVDRLQRGEVIIIDDFPFPWKYEEFINRKHHQIYENVYFVGTASPLYDEEHEALIHVVEETLGLITQPGPKIRTRVTTTEDKEKRTRNVHVDPYDLVAVMYLSELPKEIDPNDVGTLFYSFKGDGTKKVDMSGDMTRWNTILGVCSMEHEAWEVWLTVPFKRNRAVFFSGSLFHSPGNGFYGSNMQDGRVTLDLFSWIEKS